MSIGLATVTPLPEPPRVVEAKTPGGLLKVNIRAALGRILGTPVKSRMNVPGHINSAMDGYAINAADIPQDGIRTLAIIGSSFAGKPFSGAFALGVPCAS